MVILAALGSALAYSVAMVLQQRSAEQVAPGFSLRPRLLVELMRRRWWLVGIAANVVAFGLRAAALDHGSLVLVQPLVLSGLVLALVLESVVVRRPVTRPELAAGGALVVGLALFLVAASPSRGLTSPPARSWLVLAIVMAPLVAIGLIAAGREAGERRAAWLAFAGAFFLAATAALTKQTAATWSDGLGPFLSSWPVYALIGVAGIAVILTQSAFQAGPLRAALPVLSVVEPLTSIAIGAAVFHERVATSGWARAGQLGGLVLLMAGVVSLTRRPTMPAVASSSGTMTP
jgi:drug/metabolite transporter (DMT)-like permease